MLKGNLIVGKTQSVVVHAESLHDLIKLADAKSQGSTGCAPLCLRVNLTDTGALPDASIDGISRRHIQPVPQQPHQDTA